MLNLCCLHSIQYSEVIPNDNISTGTVSGRGYLLSWSWVCGSSVCEYSLNSFVSGYICQSFMSPLSSTGLPVVYIQNIRGTCCALLPSLQPAVLFIYRFSSLTPPQTTVNSWTVNNQQSHNQRYSLQYGNKTAYNNRRSNERVLGVAASPHFCQSRL